MLNLTRALFGGSLLRRTVFQGSASEEDRLCRDDYYVRPWTVLSSLETLLRMVIFGDTDSEGGPSSKGRLRRGTVFGETSSSKGLALEVFYEVYGSLLLRVLVGE